MTWAIVVLYNTQAIAQFNIQIEENTVSCICLHSSDSLYVFRGNIPKRNHHIYGRHSRSKSGDTLYFTPIIPFQLGAQYMAICGKKMRTFTKPIPEDYEYAVVQSIYPSASELPENALKFYIKFSKPMISIAYQFLSLVDADSEVINRGLLKEIPELWNEDYTELTVWIEPGRIKRGLGPNEILGPVLRAGGQYSLVISPELVDGRGVLAKNVLTKTFIARGADRKSPNLENWVVEQVKIDGKMGLQITFDEALDYGSGSQAFHIPGVVGNWSMLPGERSILFNPDSTLEAGDYKIQIDPKVEDLAGNNLQRLFDSEVNIDLKKKEKEKFILSIKIQ